MTDQEADTHSGLTDAAGRVLVQEKQVHPSYRHWLMMNFACYLVRANGRTILIDTGWGDHIHYAGYDHGGQLISDLDAIGVGPDEVDIVTFTHLHVDHIGWNLTAD